MNLNSHRHKGHFQLRIPVYAVHISIWLILILIPSLLFRNVKFDTGLPKGFFIITTLVHIGLFYFNIYFLYPRLLTRRFWPIYILALAGMIPVLYYLKLLLIKLANGQFILNETNKPIILFPPTRSTCRQHKAGTFSASCGTL
jgi:two-component system LytT family sensor kinase